MDPFQQQFEDFAARGRAAQSAVDKILEASPLPRGARLAQVVAARLFHQLLGAPDVRVHVHGVAKPAGSKKAFAIKKGGQYTGRTVVVDDNKNSRSWKQEVTHQVGNAIDGVRGRPLAVVFEIVVGRPAGHFNARGGLKPSAPEHPAVRPDVLKLARAIEDAMQGVAYRNDQQIVIELLVKRYAKTDHLGTEPAGVVINLWELAE